jgi:hypothetical protein
VIETLPVTHGDQPPVANAGPNQTVVDTAGVGHVNVTLDGSASYDPDGAISTYVWTEGASQIASGKTVGVDFPLGVHNVTLTVTDNAGLTGSSGTTVTVNSPPPPAPPGAFSLTAPAKGATNVSKTPTFTWGTSSGATSYAIAVSTNSTLTSPVINVSGLTGTSYTSTLTLGSRTKYYWQITATNANGSTTSSIFSFTTRR